MDLTMSKFVVVICTLFIFIFIFLENRRDSLNDGFYGLLPQS